MKTLTYHSPWGDISEGLYLTDINILSLAQLGEGPWGIATAQVPGLLIGEVAIKDYCENQGILKVLLDAGIIKPPHRYVPSGYVNYPVCFVNKHVAQEYMKE